MGFPVPDDNLYTDYSNPFRKQQRSPIAVDLHLPNQVVTLNECTFLVWLSSVIKWNGQRLKNKDRGHSNMRI